MCQLLPSVDISLSVKQIVYGELGLNGETVPRRVRQELRQEQEPVTIQLQLTGDLLVPCQGQKIWIVTLTYAQVRQY